MKLIKLGFFVLLSFFGVQFSNPVLAFNSSEQKNFAYFDDERRIFELVNKEREKRRLDSLNWNSRLADLARSYSQKMARERFFDHYDNEGNSVFDRVKAMRIKGWRQIGENLFMCEGYDKFSEIAVKGWMRSPGHRDNILKENFTETGIGVARSRDGRIYVTQIFIQS